MHNIAKLKKLAQLQYLADSNRFFFMLLTKSDIFCVFKKIQGSFGSLKQ